ncbi:MAG TPA: PAC2 family protein, partial [Mycobacteriales bacterium]|nr:PAC2 family protein [Mycobacteriales bacterium]
MTDFETFPELHDPILVGAFEGWNDAADAATSAVEHLELIWDARPLAALDPDDYYDVQVNRPTVSMVDGVTRRISWPTTRFSVCRPPDSDRDVVLMRGIEPNMRWRAFCEEVLEVYRELGIEMAVGLGALLA